MNIRQRTEEIERTVLSEYAALAEKSMGRARPEDDCELRTCYQRDRDRILHSKAFRRLKHKTQVFLSPLGDHYRTRLTHTLEVSQISRTIARALRLNEDLTEAIALGHDLGHTPFGHAGERALAQVSETGFKHYEQSVRVVEKLERYPHGLNLCAEVIDGIARHTNGAQAQTLEGRIVRVSDRIAYINHDIEDAVSAGILDENDLPYDVQYTLGRGKSARISTLIRSIVEHSVDDVVLDPDIQTAFDKLHAFMFDSVYTNPVAKGEEAKVLGILVKLYEHFCENPDKLPDEYKDIYEQEGADRAVCDYLAGMTDRYVIAVYEDLFIPLSWPK